MSQCNLIFNAVSCPTGVFWCQVITCLQRRALQFEFYHTLSDSVYKCSTCSSYFLSFVIIFSCWTCWTSVAKFDPRFPDWEASTRTALRASLQRAEFRDLAEHPALDVARTQGSQDMLKRVKTFWHHFRIFSHLCSFGASSAISCKVLQHCWFMLRVSYGRGRITFAYAHGTYLKISLGSRTVV